MKIIYHNVSAVHYLIIVISVLIFISCKTSKINVSNDFTNVKNEPEYMNEHKPVIVFLNCSLAYDSIRKEYDLSLINKIIVEGKIKESGEIGEVGEKCLKYCVLNKNAQIIMQKYMPSPLEQTVEYVDEWNNLRKKDVRWDNKQFSLRIPLSSEAQYISFFDRQERQLLLIDLTK